MMASIVYSILVFIIVSSAAEASYRINLRPIVKWDLPIIRESWGSTTLINYKNLYYTGEIQLGTPRQPFTVIFDTSSTTLWVYSKDCWWSWVCWTRRSFNYKKSSTYQKGSNVTSFASTDATISGRYADDVLTIGSGNHTVMFVEATKSTAGLIRAFTDKYDGVLGLGFSTGSNCLLEDIFQSLPVSPEFSGFSLYLSRDNDGNRKGGEIIFGDLDTSIFQGETLTMFELAEAQQWAITVNQISANGTSVLAKSAVAVLDTSTADIIGPTVAVSALLSQLGIASNGQVDCNDIEKYPDISVVIGGNTYTLEPKDYISVSSFLWMKKCKAAISTQQKDSWILGDSFLSKFYTVWDMQGKKFGLAHLKNEFVN